jgi:hypothetical protein
MEAFAVGPDGTAYIGFRAPLSDEKGKALLLPVTNFQKLMSGEAKTAEFGKPISLDFHDAATDRGRGIRDIVWSPEMGKFLILAWNYGVSGAAIPQDLPTQLFAWDGPGENGIYKSAEPNAKVTYLTQNGKDPEGKPKVSSIATSSRRISCSTRKVGSRSLTSGWPSCWAMRGPPLP